MNDTSIKDLVGESVAVGCIVEVLASAGRGIQELSLWYVHLQRLVSPHLFGLVLKDQPIYSFGFMLRGESTDLNQC